MLATSPLSASRAYDSFDGFKAFGLLTGHTVTVDEENGELIGDSV